MRTDTIFFQLFQTFDSLLFELVGLPPEAAAGYQFTSVEIKEKAFRFDGIFIPDSVDKNIWFVEVQFQKRAEFYWEFIGEIFLYLSQYKPEHDWKAVAIFAKRSIETESPKQFRELFASDQIVRVYLNELPQDESLNLGIVRLIVAPKRETIALAHQLAERVGQGDRERMIEFIEAVLLYKFPQMSREEVEAMFTLGDLKKTRVYREAKLEGIREGEQRGKLEGEKIGTERGQILGLKQGLKQAVVRLLTRKFGKVTQKAIKRLDKLSVEQLEELTEAVLDFERVADLEAWLTSKK
ncbi:MAG: Rpn family recombination-promoting nuclease/putative transposase [Pseudanabaena sp.]